MSKSHFCLLSFLLLFSMIAVQSVPAEDLVTLKNLSWEEQKNQTRIILETNQPLIYSVTDSQNSEVVVELSNLDLRNLPQELFINTNEVVSLQTFPQSSGQKSRIIVKMTAVRPHHVSTEQNKLYIDVTGSPQAENQLSPITTQLPPAVEAKAEPKATGPAETMSAPDQPVEAPVADYAAEPKAEPKALEPKTAEPIQTVKPTQEKKSTELIAHATEVKDIRVDQSDAHANVILVGNGSFQYDVFELSNPSRLVVDLKSVGIAPGVKNVVNSAGELFSKVRLGQYQTSPKVARAVIDLRKKVPYSVTMQGTELRIHLGDKGNLSDADTQPAMEEESQEEPAAVQAEAEPVKDVTPVEDEIVITPQTKKEPVAKAPEVKMADAKTAEPKAPETNEQFYQIKPDTSLFSQEGGEGGAETSAPARFIRNWKLRRKDGLRRPKTIHR